MCDLLQEIETLKKRQWNLILDVILKLVHNCKKHLRSDEILLFIVEGNSKSFTRVQDCKGLTLTIVSALS